MKQAKPKLRVVQAKTRMPIHEKGRWLPSLVVSRLHQPPKVIQLFGNVCSPQSIITKYFVREPW